MSETGGVSGHRYYSGKLSRNIASSRVEKRDASFRQAFVGAGPLCDPFRISNVFRMIARKHGTDHCWAGFGQELTDKSPNLQAAWQLVPAAIAL